MNDSELCAIIDRQLRNSITANSVVESDQSDANDYYHGRPYGDEIEGRSAVVTRDVLETVEWIKPSLMRIFGDGGKVCVFDPIGPEDEDSAEQDTDAVTQILMKDNDWFLTVYEWVHDALVQKVGYIKVYPEEVNETRTETYYGQTDQQLAELINGEDVEALEHTPYVEMTDLGPITLHNIKFRYTETRWKITVDTLPSEEVKVPKDHSSINLDSAYFVAHEREMTASDLIEMGIDKKIVDQLGLDKSDESELEYSRSSYETSWEEEETDKSMRPITVQECYLKLDMDGDGIAELHRVLKSGSHILEQEECSDIPIVAMSAIPLPHEHVGLAEADLIMDLQRIRSSLLRQMLDNLYLTNNPEKEVVTGKANMDDLQVSVVGGIKRVKERGSITPLTVPFTAGASIPVMEMLDSMKESRTGISRHTQGLDADALAQSTKGAFMGAIKQASQRVEMIARIFSETGFRLLFKKTHAMVRKYQDVPRMIKIRNEWTEVDATEWKERTNMSVTVGTGNVSDEELIGKLMALAERQEKHLLQGSPMVSMKNLYNTYEQIIEKSGLKSVERYFTNPEEIEPKQPEPSIEDRMLELQRQIELLRGTQKSRDLDLKEREQTRKEYETGLKVGEMELDAAIDVAGAGITGAGYPRVVYEG